MISKFQSSLIWQIFSFFVRLSVIIYLVSLNDLLALNTAFLTDRPTNFMIITDLLSFFPFGITCVMSMSLASMLHLVVFDYIDYMFFKIVIV